MASDYFTTTWMEFERLRQLVPERADWHLHNWGVWSRKDHLTDGYETESSGMGTGGGSGKDAFAHLCEPVDEWAASVSDTIIYELPITYRIAISNVYEASTWQFRSTAILEQTLIEAAAAFWVKAVKRDLT